MHIFADIDVFERMARLADKSGDDLSSNKYFPVSLEKVFSLYSKIMRLASLSGEEPVHQIHEGLEEKDDNLNQRDEGEANAQP